MAPPHGSWLTRWLTSAQYRLEATGFDALGAVVGGLGPDRAGDASAACWRLLAPLNKRHARAAGHLRTSMPELGESEIEAILTRMWDNLGRTSAESFHLARLINERDRFEIGEDTREAIRIAKARGAVFVSLHQGNWELASPLLHANGLPVAGVYQRLQNPFVEARASAARAPFYALGLHAKGVETARTLLRILGNGGTVTIMSDLRDLSGLPVPFFGRPAPSTVFPALLARGRNTPLFAGVVMRKDGATFRVKTVEIPVARTADRDADLAATTAAIQAVFEGFIRENPGQWMWGHRRWNR